MPEGDTVHKLAAVLRQGLVDRPLRRLETRGGQRPFAAPTRVEQISVLGKHCMLELDNGYTLRVHLGMHGSWHRYSREAGRPRGQFHLLLESESEVFVCLQPGEVELLRSSEVARHPALTSLGPDLLGAEPDWSQLRVRLHQFSAEDRPLGEVLLDQRIAAGLGNVYKNELCFLGPLAQDRPWIPLRGTSPFRPLGECSAEDVIGLFQRGRLLLLANLGGWPRTTTGDARRRSLSDRRPRCWVYGRQRLPCLRCQTPLLSRHQGLNARATQWCPACQPLDRWGPSFPQK